MRDALDSLYQWFCHHSMKLNAAKTQMLVLGTHGMLKTLPPVTISFCDTFIHDAKVVKNPGMMIDSHLNFQAHLDYLRKKCNGLLIALSHIRHVIPAKTLSPVVQALVVSLVRYGISVYGSSGATTQKKVQKILNFCARVVTGRKKIRPYNRCIPSAALAQRRRTHRLPPTLHCPPDAHNWHTRAIG